MRTKKTEKLPHDEAMEKLRVELNAYVLEYAERQTECVQHHADAAFTGAVEAINAFREVVKNLGWPLAGPSGESVDIMQGGVFELPKYGDTVFRDLVLRSFRLDGFNGPGLGEFHINGCEGGAMVGRLMTGKREVKPGKYRWAFIAVRVDDDEKKGG